MSVFRKAPFLTGWVAFNAFVAFGGLIWLGVLAVLGRLPSVRLSSNAMITWLIIAGLCWGYIGFILAIRITAWLGGNRVAFSQSFYASLKNSSHLKAWGAFLAIMFFCLLPLAVPRTFPGLFPEVVENIVEQFDDIIDLLVGFFVYRFVLKNCVCVPPNINHGSSRIAPFPSP